MKTKFLIIVFVCIIIPLGFLAFIANEGYSPYHAGLVVVIVNEKEAQERIYDSEPQVVTRENLQSYPEILTMLDLLIQEKDNPQHPRNVIIDSKSYFVSPEHNEYSVQNFMSDDGAQNLYRKFQERFGSPIIFEENVIRMGSWIA